MNSSRIAAEIDRWDSNWEPQILDAKGHASELKGERIGMGRLRRYFLMVQEELTVDH